MARRMMRAALGCAAAAVLASCATASSSSQTQAAAIAPLQLTTCRPEGASRDMRCGVYSVPENRAEPNGRRLNLNVVVVPARNPAPDSTPIFFLSGGPGQAATEGATFLADTWESDAHDVVLVDVRGSGGDNRLDCPPAADAGPQAYLEPAFADRTRYANCLATLSQNHDLTQYSTHIAAQDIDEVRQALGYETINLYGISYGTRMAITYMRYYGAHVRAALLSGAVPLANRNPLYHAPAAQRAVERLDAECKADAACNAAFDVRGDLDAIMAELSARPARVTVTRPRDGAQFEVTLTAPSFFEGLRVMLYSSQSSRTLPYMLRQARDGNLAPFAEAALASNAALDDGLRIGLLLAVTCSEELPRISDSDIASVTAGTYMGELRVRNQRAACEGWPRATIPASYYAPFRSDIPVLIISGDLDPVTPPEWGERARESFTNSRHIVTPGGHGEGGECVEPISAAFMRDPDLTGLDTSCVAELALPGFVLDASGLAASQ